MHPPLRVGPPLLVDSIGNFDVLGGSKVDPGHHHLLREQVGGHRLDGESQAPVALLALEVHGIVYANTRPSYPFALCQVLVRCVGPGWPAVVLFCVVSESASISAVVRARAGRSLSFPRRVGYWCVMWARDGQPSSPSVLCWILIRAGPRTGP